MTEKKLPFSIWQPIETAPMDGTLVLVFIPNLHEDMHTARFGRQWMRPWKGKGWLWKDENLNYNGFAPTHWMPLPSPPNSIVEATVVQDSKQYFVV